MQRRQMGRLAQCMILMISNSPKAFWLYLVDLLDFILILFFLQNNVLCASVRLGANEVMTSMLTNIC